MRDIHRESTTSSLLLAGHPVAHGTAADAAQEFTGFEGLRCLRAEHLTDSREPEAVFIGEVVACSSAVAFEERIVTENLEA